MKSKQLWQLLLLSLLVAALIGIWSQWDHLDLNTLDVWLQQAGWLAPAVFILVYALGVSLFLPAVALTLLGGALFGPWWGTALNLLGATLGATLSFLVARYLAADWVEHNAGERLQKIKRGVEKEGWQFVAFVRLVPLFPFVLLNYLLGLTRIPISHYVITSIICMLPGCLAYSWLGHTGREAASGAENVIQNAFIALGLLASVAFLPRFVRHWRDHRKR